MLAISKLAKNTEISILKQDMIWNASNFFISFLIISRLFCFCYFIPCAYLSFFNDETKENEFLPQTKIV